MSPSCTWQTTSGYRRATSRRGHRRTREANSGRSPHRLRRPRAHTPPDPDRPRQRPAARRTREPGLSHPARPAWTGAPDHRRLVRGRDSGRTTSSPHRTDTDWRHSRTAWSCSPWRSREAAGTPHVPNTGSWPTSCALGRRPMALGGRCPSGLRHAVEAQGEHHPDALNRVVGPVAHRSLETQTPRLPQSLRSWAP